MAFEFKNDPEFMKQRMDFLKQLKEKSDYGNGKDFIFKEKPNKYMPDGDAAARLMPGTWENAKHYALDVFIHFNIGPEQGQFLCLENMQFLTKNNLVCPVCEEYRKAKSANDAEYAKKIQSQRRALAYVIDRQNPDKGPLIWSMPYTRVAKPLVTLAFSKRTGEFLIIDDPVNGRDISFVIRGKGLATTYESLKLDFEPSPLSDNPEQAARWLKYIVDRPLTSILSFKDPDYIRHAMTGAVSAPGEAETTLASKASALKLVKDAPKAEVAETKKTMSMTEAASHAESVATGLTVKQIKSMSRADIGKIITDRKLDIDESMYTDDDDLKTAVLLSLDMLEE